MKPIELQIDEYHILVRETQDHRIIEWYGSLTMIPQENGEMYLDISFNNDGIYRNIYDQSLDADSAELSIELMDCEIFPADEFNHCEAFLQLSSAPLI